MLAGYTLILLIDKVIFDTHAVFGDHDHEQEHKTSNERTDVDIDGRLRKSSVFE